MLTTIPEKTEDSLGQEKQDSVPDGVTLDPRYWTTAAQLEAIKSAIIAACTDLGIDGTEDPDTIKGKLALLAGDQSIYRERNELLAPVLVESGGERFSYDIDGGASVTEGNFDATPGGGMGHVKLLTAAGASYAQVWDGYERFLGAHDLDLRARIKAPATWTGVTARVGICDYTGVATVALFTMVNGLFRLYTESSTTSQNGNAVASIDPPTAGEWFELRIVTVGGVRVDLYIDDVLAASQDSALKVPAAADGLSGFIAYLERTAGGPHTMLVDWYELRATRL